MAKGYLRIFQGLALVITVALASGQPSTASFTVKHLSTWSTWSNCKSPAGYLLDIDQSAGTPGHPAAKIESQIAEQKGAFASMFFDLSPELFSGKKLQFTALIKTAKVGQSATLWATAEDDNDIITIDDMENRPIAGTKEWHKYSIVLPVPPQSKRLRVGLMLRGGGTVWLKDPNVAMADQHDRITARPYDAKKFSLNKLTLEPKNLSFGDSSGFSDQANSKLFNWGVSTDKGFTIKIDQNTALKNQPSVLINGDLPDPTGFASIYQIFSAEKYRGKRVRFSGYLKPSSISDWASLFMQVDAADRVLAFDAMEERPVKGTADWNKYDVVLDVPPQSKKIKIGFLQAGGGKSWLSNCSLDIVNTDVPTTGKPVVDDRFPPMKLPAKPKLDFE